MLRVCYLQSIDSLTCPPTADDRQTQTQTHADTRTRSELTTDKLGLQYRLLLQTRVSDVHDAFTRSSMLAVNSVTMVTRPVALSLQESVLGAQVGITGGGRGSLAVRASEF